MAEHGDNPTPRDGTPGESFNADERLPAKLAGDLAVLFGGADSSGIPGVPERVDEAVQVALRERFLGESAGENAGERSELVALSDDRAKPQAAGAWSDDNALSARWRIGWWVGSALAAAAAVAIVVIIGPWSWSEFGPADNNKLAVNEGERNIERGDRSSRDAKDDDAKDGDTKDGGPRIVRNQPAPGDVNADGKVDILDAYLLQRRIELARQLEAMWDVTGDGRVDASDVSAIAARAVSLEGGRS